MWTYIFKNQKAWGDILSLCVWWWKFWDNSIYIYARYICILLCTLCLDNFDKWSSHSHAFSGIPDHDSPVRQIKQLHFWVLTADIEGRKSTDNGTDVSSVCLLGAVVVGLQRNLVLKNYTHMMVFFYWKGTGATPGQHVLRCFLPTRLKVFVVHTS